MDEAQPVIPFDYDDVHFELRVRREPSGLAGRVFHGHEQIAGVRLYHSEDTSRLLTMATRDRAFRRAAQRLAATAAGVDE